METGDRRPKTEQCLSLQLASKNFYRSSTRNVMAKIHMFDPALKSYIKWSKLLKR